MNKFQKLSQINKDIEILETAGEIRAAEIMNRKFIKEAQVAAPVNQNRTYYGPSSVNPETRNYVERGENSMTSVRDGVSTNFNFSGLPPEMVPVKIEKYPGKYTTVMRPKNNIGNPYATMPSDPNANIPGYNEFLKLRPQPYQIRDFIESKGTTTDAGMALFNELSTQKGSKSLNLAPAATPAARTQVQPMAEPTNAGPYATPATSVMPTPIARPMQPTKAQMPSVPQASQTNTVPTNNSAQPVTQDNFKNYYTEQSDTSFYQQQNTMPAEAPVYQQAINQIAGLLNTKNPINRTMAQQIYENTIGQFKDPKRKQAFANQFQRLVSKNFPGQSLKPGA
jgi:hypothetical protein